MPRTIRQVERLHFSGATLAPIVARMDRLAAAGDGWINLVPTIGDRDDRPTTLGFMALLSGGGTGATMITWIPGRSDRRGKVGPSLGITHTAAARARAALAAAEVPVPATWRVEQDHPRRGVVLRLPEEEPNEEALSWAMEAVGALTAPDRVTSWQAEVHLPAS